jgi:hypothetical protein
MRLIGYQGLVQGVKNGAKRKWNMRKRRRERKIEKEND